MTEVLFMVSYPSGNSLCEFKRTAFGNTWNTATVNTMPFTFPRNQMNETFLFAFTLQIYLNSKLVMLFCSFNLITSDLCFTHMAKNATKVIDLKAYFRNLAVNIY